MTAATVEPLPIFGCGVLSPAGFGLDRLGEALRTGEPGCSDPAEIPGDDPVPEPVRVVPGVRPRELLGRKGTRFLDRTTTLGLVSSKMALEAAPPGETDPTGIGVVMGTSTGSVRSSSEFARDTLIQERPYLVNPGLFPNTVMNGCAGQIAIWHALRGVNATMSGGQLSSLHAVRYARNTVDRRQAERLLVGGVEELSPQTAWAWRRSGALPKGAAVGEACAVFVLGRSDSAPAGDAPIAELLACEVGYCPAPDRRPRLADGLARCVARALDRSGVAPDGSEVVVSFGAATPDSGEQRIERRAVERVLGQPPGRTIRVKDVVGECYSATGALQLAATVAHWRSDQDGGEPGQRTGIALITTVGRDGNVGCLVVRRGNG